MGIEKANFLGFEEWETQNQELIAELEKEVCLECDGTGKSKCPECGHFGTCTACDGQGYNGPSPREIYNKLLNEDKKKLEEFLKLAS